jgi:hypothetical protein
MTVAAILSGKGHETITARSDAPLSDICETLAKIQDWRRGRLQQWWRDRGYHLSERDIVRTIGEPRTAASLNQPCPA